MNKKFKDFVNEIVDLPKLVFRLWLSLWIILIILIFFKVCFGSLYPIVVDNKFFIKFCNLAEENFWLDISVSLIFYLINSILLFQIGIKKIKLKWYGYLFVIVTFTGIFFFKTFFNNYLAIILEVFFGIGVPIMYNLKCKTFDKKIKDILYPIIFCSFVSLFQLSLMYIRGIKELLSQVPTIIKYTLQMDYYIFLIITLIWEVYFMGNLGWFFFGRDITTLKAELEKEENKKEPNKKKILKLKEKIKELEKND